MKLGFALRLRIYAKGDFYRAKRAFLVQIVTKLGFFYLEITLFHSSFSLFKNNSVK